MSYRLRIEEGKRCRYMAKIQVKFKGLWLTVNSDEFNSRRECKAFYRMIAK